MLVLKLVSIISFVLCIKAEENAKIQTSSKDEPKITTTNSETTTTSEPQTTVFNLPMKDGDLTSQPSKEFDETTQAFKVVNQTTLPSKDVQKTTQPLPLKDTDQTTQAFQDVDQTTQLSKEVNETTQPSTENNQTTFPSKEIDPTTVPSKAIDPTTLPSKAIEPTTLPSKAIDPTTLPSKAIDPTTLPSKAIDPTTLPSKAIDPTTLPSKEIDQTTLSSKAIDQTTLSSKEIDPTTLPLKEIDPNTLPSKEIDPTTLPSKEIDPTTLPSKEIDPTTLPSKEIDPTTLPSKAIDQTTLPSKEIDQTTLPSKEIGQTTPTLVPTTLPPDLKFTTIKDIGAAPSNITRLDNVTTQPSLIISMETTPQPQIIENNAPEVTSQLNPAQPLGITEISMPEINKTQPTIEVTTGAPPATVVVQETTTHNSLDIDTRRPLYVIGHMTNSLEEVKTMLDRSANALEFDLNFDRSGTPTYVFHGYMCDLGRMCDSSENFDRYMETIANITTPSNIRYRRRLVLIYIDLKLHNLDTMHMEIAGENTAAKVVHHLGWRKNVKPEERSVVNVLFSIEYPSFHPVFFGLKRELKRLLSDDLYYKHIGWSFHGDGFTESTAAAVWRAVGIERNIWRGYGAPNMFAFLVGDGILDDAVCNREQTSVPAKVFRWTVDSPIDIRTLLRKSIDAVVTNFPQVARLVLRDEEFASTYKLATIEDSPWEKYVDPNNLSKLCKRGSIFKLFDQIFDI